MEANTIKPSNGKKNFSVAFLMSNTENELSNIDPCQQHNKHKLSNNRKRNEKINNKANLNEDEDTTCSSDDKSLNLIKKKRVKLYDDDKVNFHQQNSKSKTKHIDFETCFLKMQNDKEIDYDNESHENVNYDENEDEDNDESDEQEEDLNEGDAALLKSKIL